MNIQNDIILWLYHWQTLIGSIIGSVTGGLMGFIGAYWVAHSAKVSREIAAANIIFMDLQTIQETTKLLDNSLARCDLLLMTSAPTASTPFPNANSAFILVQPTPGRSPTSLFFAERTNATPEITHFITSPPLLPGQALFPSNQNVGAFTAALYPGVTNNIYSDIFNLSSAQKQQAISISGHASSTSLSNEMRANAFALRYFLRKPNVSPLIDSSIATLIGYPNNLPGLLTMFRKIYMNMEESFNRIERNVARLQQQTTMPTQPTSTFLTGIDINTIDNGAHQISELAEKIMPFLQLEFGHF